MDIVTREDLERILSDSGEYRLSVFMPTVRVGAEIQQNAIRLKNLIDQAEQKLLSRQLSVAEVEDFLRPLKDMIDDRTFWEKSEDGLAIFRSEEKTEVFRLPFSVEEITYLNSRFYTKPLIPMLNDDGRYYLLALNLDKTRLFEASKYEFKEVKLEKVPTSLEEAANDDNIQQFRFHIKSRPGGTADRSGGNLMATGGVGEENKKEDIQRFFQMLEKGVYNHINRSTSPLVLAGVEYLLPIFREINRYQHLMEETITGNPEDRKRQELHRLSWEIVEPSFQQSRKEAVEAYHILAKDRQATKEIESILPASFYGQVETLLVAKDMEVWGKFDSENIKVKVNSRPQPEDEDLTDLAIAHTLKNGGSVYTFDPADMPDGATLAAALRYPLDGLDYNKGA